MQIFYQEKTDSTNDEVKKLYQQGAHPPFWLYTGKQTAGRGRKGRSWIGLSGNLMTTGFYLLHRPLYTLPQLSFVTALAVSDSIEEYVNPEYIQLKWPNDVYIKGYKCAGVLLESWPETDQSDRIMIAIGIGLNIKSHPESLDNEATHLALHLKPDCDKPLGSLPLLTCIAARFDYWYDLWIKQGFGTLREVWHKRALGFGQRVEVKTGPKTVSGIMTGLDERGGLILQQDKNQSLTVYSGEACFSETVLKQFRK